MLNRFIAVLAVAVGAVCFPAAAAEKAASGEPRACAALTGRDKQIVEHLPREMIEEVRRLMDAPPSTPFRAESLNDEARTIVAGVTIVVRPVEGMTVERLRRLVRCGLMRAEAADPARPTDWPGTPPGTTTYVYSTVDDFVIELRSPDRAAADQMWRTAQQLEPSKD